MIKKYFFALIISLIVSNPVQAKDESSDPDTPLSAQESSSHSHDIYDPWEDTNRAIFELNMAMDIILFRPLAELYGTVVPSPLRTGVRNFLGNLSSPIILINDILQLNPERAMETIGRFVINTIFGIGGLFDVASEIGIAYHHEDLGLTMASHGVESGPYMVLPILGPSNFRDFFGKIGDIFMDPCTWIAYNNNWQGAAYGRTGTDALDSRTEARDLTDGLEKSLDPYAQYRALYTQNRDYSQTSGNATVDTSDLPGGE